MAPRRYLTLQQVASPEWLNCSTSTVRRMLARREIIEPLRLSSRILRWDSEALRLWMSKRAEQSS